MNGGDPFIIKHFSVVLMLLLVRNQSKTFDLACLLWNIHV